MKTDQKIAKFMGFPVSLNTLTDTVVWFDHDGQYPVKYSESYDWIMPVVDKIESLGYKCSIELYGEGTYSVCFEDERHDTVVQVYEDNRLKAIYMAVEKMITIKALL